MNHLTSVVLIYCTVKLQNNFLKNRFLCWKYRKGLATIVHARLTEGWRLFWSLGIWLGRPDEDLSDPDFLPPDPLDFLSADDPWLDFRLLFDSPVPPECCCNSLVCSAAKSSICLKSCSCSPDSFPGPASLSLLPKKRKFKFQNWKRMITISKSRFVPDWETWNLPFCYSHHQECRR